MKVFKKSVVVVDVIQVLVIHRCHMSVFLGYSILEFESSKVEVLVEKNVVQDLILEFKHLSFAVHPRKVQSMVVSFHIRQLVVIVVILDKAKVPRLFVFVIDLVLERLSPLHKHLRILHSRTIFRDLESHCECHGSVLDNFVALNASKFAPILPHFVLCFLSELEV